MGKFYMKPMNPEFYDYTLYFDEEDAKNNLFWAGGNKDYKDINEDLYKEIVDGANSIGEDLENNYFPQDDDDDEYDEAKADQEAASDLKYYFGITGLNPVQQDKLVRECIDFYMYGLDDEETLDFVCRILSIKHKKEFIHGGIGGNSQGEYMDYICPKDYEKHIPFVESVLFGTGTEFQITMDRYDSEPDMSEVDVYSDYTNEYDEDAIKAHFAKDLHCSPDDIVILKADEE